MKTTEQQKKKPEFFFSGSKLHWEEKKREGNKCINQKRLKRLDNHNG